MQITRLYTGEDGESRFEDVEIALEDAGAIGRLSAPIPATGVIFRETGPDYDYDWHPAPQRQYIIMLEGELEVEAGDGTKRHFSAGDVLLVEDTTGRGHRSRTTNNQVRKTIFVTLD
ncbi:MAG TPA: cupin domain-containing protein [Abditibacteriaceae bacterium]|nr:cupin domain-containing protein [Abditibacteriaceae bacterium]